MRACELLVLGGQGRVGQLMQRHWSDAQHGRSLWQGRTATATPRALCWNGQGDLPLARAVLVLSGVTRGTPEELAQNVKIAEALAQAAGKTGASVVFFASTMAVYGRAAGRAHEECALEGLGDYGAAKLAAEGAFSRACPLPVVSLRLGNVVGCDLLGDMVRAGREIVLDRFADGRGPIRSYLGGRHLVRVVHDLALAADQGAALPQVLNVASSQEVDMADLLCLAQVPFVGRPAPPQALARAVMDCSRLDGLVPPLEAEVDVAGLAQDWREGMA